MSENAANQLLEESAFAPTGAVVEQLAAQGAAGDVPTLPREEPEQPGTASGSSPNADLHAAVLAQIQAANAALQQAYGAAAALGITLPVPQAPAKRKIATRKSRRTHRRRGNPTGEEATTPAEDVANADYEGEDEVVPPAESTCPPPPRLRPPMGSGFPRSSRRIHGTTVNCRPGLPPPIPPRFHRQHRCTVHPP